MARGWESKSVADQIEEGNQRDALLPAGNKAEDRQLKERLESLRLSRSRILEQLDRATQPAYREMLGKSLQAIEREIEGAKAGHARDPLS
jgi:hypothetical protein